MNDADQTLLVRAARGDRQALARLYREHVDALYAFIHFKVARNAALAEDVLHDTFVRALDSAPAFDPRRGPLRAWLCELSRNVIRRHLTAAERLAGIEALDAEAAGEIPAALCGQRPPAADELLARREVQALINAAIERLPMSYRCLLEQKYLLGESLDELARGLGISADAASSQLARARRAFRDAFKDACRRQNRDVANVR